MAIKHATCSSDRCRDKRPAIRYANDTDGLALSKCSALVIEDINIH